MKPFEINGKPRKKCFCKRCEDCNFYMDWNVEDFHGIKSVEWKCSWDALFMSLPHIIGKVDGGQKAANEARNYTLATARGLAAHGLDAPARILTDQIKELEGNGFNNNQAKRLLED